jgi:uncharacterized membrane protein
MKRWLIHPFRTWIAGALTLLPLAATALIIGWMLRIMVAYLGPESAFGRLLTYVGLGVTEIEWLGYLLGIVTLLALIYGVGLLVQTGLQRGLALWVNGLMHRIPVVRTIYDVFQKMVGLVARREGDGLQSMSAVWIHFGGRGEPTTVVLGLLSTPKPVPVGDAMLLGVLVPTAPVPIGGGLLYVPPDWVTPADIGVEGLTSIYVSMGVTSAQYLKPPTKELFQAPHAL